MRFEALLAMALLVGGTLMGCGYDGPRMTVEELKEAMDQGREITVIDVRPAALYRQGHIPGAASIPREMLGRRVAQISEMDGTVVLICHRGRNALSACRELARAGVTATLTLGGMEAWKRAGYPLRRGS